MKNTAHPAARIKALRAAWQQRPARERRTLLAGGTFLALLVLWQGAIAPAWSLWREAPARQARIDAQTRQMLQLQAQMQGLQAATRIGRREALTQLQNAADTWLGPGAQLQPQGEQVRVTLKAAPASGLAQWLAVARNQAQSQPLQVQLLRSDSATADRPEALWQGSLLMRLP